MPQASYRYKNICRSHKESCDAVAEEKIKDFLHFEIHIPPKIALYFKLPTTFSQIVCWDVVLWESMVFSFRWMCVCVCVCVYVCVCLCVFECVMPVLSHSLMRCVRHLNHRLFGAFTEDVCWLPSQT